jgi:tol-pal system protein YbgF
VAGCASQEDLYSLDDRLTAIERQQLQSKRELEQQKQDLDSTIKSYQISRNEKDQTLRNQSAGLRVLLDQMREELQAASGRLEELEYGMQQQARADEAARQTLANELSAIRQLVTQNREQITHIQQYLNLEPAPSLPAGAKTSPPPARPQTPALAPPKDDAALYTAAKSAFDQGDYDNARIGFEKMLETYPKSKQADNAQFWIGEIYYRQKWYERAILEYQKVIENYPKGNKVRASLLKQGFAFLNIGDRANARLILKELIKKYPRSKEAEIAKKKLKEL